MSDSTEPIEQPFETAIASVFGTDAITHHHIMALLNQHGILCGLGGSRVHDVLVSKRKAERAEAILRSDAQQRRYAICFVEGWYNESPRYEEWERRDLNLRYDQVLQMPEFARSTALGCVLRHSRVQRNTTKLIYVLSILWLRRDFLSPAGNEQYGYGVELTLSDTPMNEEWDAWLVYQVWAGGRKMIYRGGGGGDPYFDTSEALWLIDDDGAPNCYPRLLAAGPPLRHSGLADLTATDSG